MVKTYTYFDFCSSSLSLLGIYACFGKKVPILSGVWERISPIVLFGVESSNNVYGQPLLRGVKANDQALVLSIKST